MHPSTAANGKSVGSQKLSHGSSLMKLQLASILALVSVSALGAPTSYTIDPDHTHPSFEVDHFGGLSTWRGTFKKTTGSVELDAAAKTGTVEVIVDAASIDFAHDKLNAHVSGPEVLDVAKYPTAEYQGKFVDFADGAPKTISGNLTLHGVTRPVTLFINSFKCIEHPVLKRQVCGAARTVLLEVTFIQAPQFDVGAASQATEFFLLPRLSADRIGRLGDAACAAGTPFVEIIADTGAPPSPPHSADADVPTRPDRPTKWPAGRSRVGFYVDRPATNAIASHRACGVVPPARLRAERPSRPPRSGAPNAAPWSRPHRIDRRLRGTIDLRSPAATRAGDGRNETPRYARSPAESRFALSRRPRSAVCASSFSQRT